MELDLRMRSRWVCTALLQAGWVLAGWVPVGVAQTVPDAPSAMVQATATVSGFVKDVGETPVGGARVELLGLAGAARETTTDDGGEYRFEGVEAGPYTVLVKAEGLAEGSAQVMVPSSGSVSVPAFALKLETVNSTVEAVGQKELAELQIHQEEKQRILGVIPNFYVAYDPNTVPMTQGQKLQLASRTLIDPVTFVAAGISAGVNQATQTPEQWGKDWPGYGQRYGAQMVGALAGVGLSGFVIPAIFHQDPRYFYKGTGTKTERAKWAVKQAFEQKNDKGKWGPAFSNILGDVGSSLVTVAVYPHQDIDWGTTVGEDFGLSFAGEAFGNLMQEFVVPKLHRHKKQPTP